GGGKGVEVPATIREGVKRLAAVYLSTHGAAKDSASACEGGMLDLIDVERSLLLAEGSKGLELGVNVWLNFMMGTAVVVDEACAYLVELGGRKGFRSTKVYEAICQFGAKGAITSPS
ncbi:hypothetical protein TrRE_jg866, partial [Triparma retinervis]